MYYVIFFFFFFQAEDGIRDADVTGVQTCALPIFKSQNKQKAIIKFPNFNSSMVRLKVPYFIIHNLCIINFNSSMVRLKRSEERRVGKECRSRWSRYH